jgi:hypothetical protein
MPSVSFLVEEGGTCEERSASTKPKSCSASIALSWISISDDDAKVSRPFLIDVTRFLASEWDSLDQDCETWAAYCPKIFETAWIEVLTSVGDDE